VQGDYIIRLPYGGNILKGLYKYEDLGDGDIWGGELKLTKKVFDRHTLTLGGTFQDNFRQDQTSYIEFPPISIFDDKRDSKIWALYAQDEFAIFNNLILNAGVRHDQYSTFGGTTNPRIALIYHPFEKTFLKLLYGRAFRAPNVYELCYQGAGSKVNPDLKPETIQTYELIWEQYLGTHLRGSASVFNYRMRDFINQLMDPTDNLLVYMNLSKIKAKGLELELEGRWANGLEGRMSYTFQDARCGVTGKTLINSPKHLAKLNLSFPFIKDKLFASMEEQFTSKRKTFAGNEANAFFTTNFTLFSQNLMKGLEISGSVYNLFDKKYGDPGSAEYVQDLLMQDGRNYRLKVTYRF
jgi:iron complex outermembrane receptor protein